MAEAGVPESTMMALAGHMSRAMLERYSHVGPAAFSDNFNGSNADGVYDRHRCEATRSLICLLSLGSDGDLFRRSYTRGNHHFTNCSLGLGLRPKTSGPSVSHCDG